MYVLLLLLLLLQSEDIFGCHRLDEGTNGIQYVESTDAAEHPTCTGQSQTINYLTKVSRVLRLRNPGLDYFESNPLS